MTRVFVTGAEGQLGRALSNVLDDHEVIAPKRADLDISQRESVLAAITDSQPDVIIHGGAWTDVDGCERDPDRAFATNALGTRYVAEAADRVGAHICYVSTDFVFDGTETAPYNEWHPTNPVSAYGHSKLAGEHALPTSATIVRTSWLTGAHGRGGFVRAILATALRDESAIHVVTDQRSSPTAAGDLALAIRRLIAHRAHGCFHVTNQGDASRFELAQAIVRWAGKDPAIVRPVATADLDPAPLAIRPAYSVLDNSALRLGGFELLPDWQTSFELLVATLM